MGRAADWVARRRLGVWPETWPDPWRVDPQATNQEIPKKLERQRWKPKECLGHLPTGST